MRSTMREIDRILHDLAQLMEELEYQTEQTYSPIPEMVTVPGGNFLYGDENEARFLQTYAIGKYPVTNKQYKAFTDATGHRIPTHWVDGKIPDGKEDHPVVNVSYHDAVAYCQWLTSVTGETYRLPTEEEWEKAARGTDGRRYPWGDEFDPQKANTLESGIGTTTPVGKYSPDGDSPYGAADMTGNVWEWTATPHSSE